MKRRPLARVALLVLLVSLAYLPPRAARSQSTPPAASPPAPATPPVAPTPPAPPSPVSGVRNKISAADLYSAESILEVHRERHGENAQWLGGLGWLARGALLVGDTAKARRYAADLRRACEQRLTDSLPLAKNLDVEGPLGAAIEVEAQLVERQRGPRAAAAFMRTQIATHHGRPSFDSRLWKRLNMLELVGKPAPPWEVEGHLGDPPPSLASLRGKPFVLFLWAEWCADCRAQAASLARVLGRHAADSVRCVALTTWYGDEALRERETARADSVWSADYTAVGPIPRVFSTASMLRYGGSSTPTFVFVDRKGVVRGYTPTRLTEDELEKHLAAILR